MMNFMDDLPVLSISEAGGWVWAAGPGGLAALGPAGKGHLVPQPMDNLACCLALPDRILVGGMPYGVAFNQQTEGLATAQAGSETGWQAGFMDHVSAPVLCLVADPAGEELLAGTQGGGILRSSNRGESWQVSNFGLQDTKILALAWAPAPSAQAWPRWSTVFAGTEEGIYRSPNGGRGWKRTDCPAAFYQCIAPALDFPRSRLVLAGTEDAGLFRSTDGGRSFRPVAGIPSQVNSILAMDDGWLMATAEALWHSTDGERWQVLPDQGGALTLFAGSAGMWVGADQGVELLKEKPWS